MRCRFLLPVYTMIALAAARDSSTVPTEASVTFHTGPGCYPDDAENTFHWKNNTLTISTPHSFVGSSSPQHCVTYLEVSGTSGWQFSIDRLTVQGRADLPTGSNGDLGVDYWFSHHPQRVHKSYVVPGGSAPYNIERNLGTTDAANSTVNEAHVEDGSAAEVLSLGAPLFGGCQDNTELALKLTAEVRGKNSRNITGALTINKTTASLRWRRCK